MKAAHPDIPWQAIAGIGNVLRHDYDEIDAMVIWQTATSRMSCSFERTPKIPRGPGGNHFPRTFFRRSALPSPWLVVRGGGAG